MNRQKLRVFLCNFLLLGLLLGVKDGFVALWKGQDPEPYKVFPYAVSSLPKAAQQALRAGIPIESMEDLERLIKNYLP